MSLQGAKATLALMVVATVAAGGEPAPNVDGFKAYELPAYTIVTHDEGNARQVPRVAAQIDGVLAKLLNRGALMPSAPTYISFIPDSTWMRYLEPGPGISGEFIPARFANYVIASNARDESQVSTGIFHEYTHWFLHTQFAGVQPLWFDEGLAKFIETAEFRGSEVSLGEPGLMGPKGWVPALFERSGNSVREDFAIKALELLDRAIMSRPDDVEAIWAYTVLAANLERDMPIALRRIANARAILPSSPDLAQATALLGMTMGDTVLTKKALADTLRYSKKADMALWAKKRLESTQ